MFSTPETSIHVLDKNREINPLEREEGYGGRIWITCRSLIRLAKSLVSLGEQVNRVLYGDQTSLYIAGRMSLCRGYQHSFECLCPAISYSSFSRAPLLRGNGDLFIFDAVL